MAITQRSVTVGTDNGGSATVSATTPSAGDPAQVGDVLLIIHSNNFYAATNMAAPTVSPIAVVTAVTDGAADGGTDLAHAKTYTAVVTTGGAQTVSATETGSHDEEKGLAVYVLAGVDIITPVDDAANATGVSSTTQTAPAASPSSSNSYLVTHINSGGGSATTGYAGPGSMTEQYEIHVGGLSGVGAIEVLSASGDTGTRAFTADNAVPWAAVSVAMKAAAGGTTANAQTATITTAALNAAVTTSNIRKVADRGSEQNLTAQTSTLVDLATGGSVTAGNYLLARAALDNAGASGAAVTLTVTDPRSNAWTILGPANQDPGAASAGTTCYIAYAKVVNAYTDGDDLTCDFAGVSVAAKAIVVEEYANIHATSPVAVAVTTAVGVSGTPSISRTPTEAAQMLYGALSVEGPTGDTYTEDADTTDGTWVTLTRLSTTSGTATSNQTVAGACKLVTGTTAQTWNPTITSRDWAQLAVVLAPAVASTNAPAETATITTTAEVPSTTVAPVALEATGTVAAQNASVGGSAETAAETATLSTQGEDATVVVGTLAAADTAQVTSSAQDAAARVAPTAEHAPMLVEAVFDAGSSISVELTAETPIEITAAAQDITARVAPVADTAVVTASAQDATASVSGAVNAAAQVAPVTMTAETPSLLVSVTSGITLTAEAADATTGIAPPAEGITFTAAAQDAAVSVSSAGNAAAQVALVAVAAGNASTAVVPVVGSATWTVAAEDATAATSTATNAAAQTATVTATGDDPQVSVVVLAELAAAVAEALGPVFQAGALITAPFATAGAGTSPHAAAGVGTSPHATGG